MSTGVVEPPAVTPVRQTMPSVALWVIASTMTEDTPVHSTTMSGKTALAESDRE